MIAFMWTANFGYIKLTCMLYPICRYCFRRIQGRLVSTKQWVCLTAWNSVSVISRLSIQCGNNARNDARAWCWQINKRYKTEFGIPTYDNRFLARLMDATLHSEWEQMRTHIPVMTLRYAIHIHITYNQCMPCPWVARKGDCWQLN